MVATPQYCGFFFVGLQTGKTYSVDAYVSDVNNGYLRFDGGAGAGTASPENWIAPEPVALRDFSMHTGTADTEKIRMVSNGRPTSHVLRYATHLDSLATRPSLNIQFAAGTQISAFQISD